MPDLLSAMLVLSLCTTTTDVLEFHDRAEWEAAVGRFTTVDFVLEEEGFITDEYEHLGVIFSGNTTAKRGGSYLNDGWGICGAPIEMEFTRPMWWIAADHPGALFFVLLRSGEQVYTSGSFGSGGVGFFGGLLSDEPFDAVIIRGAGPNVDDLHFGPPITPGDMDGDGDVDFSDVLAVLRGWGECPPPPVYCDADLDESGAVDFADVLIVLNNWTP